MVDNIYNIPAYLPFSDTLASWVLEKHGNDPAALSRVLIILPSRRACSALRDAFLRISSGKPLLLPRMQPIADTNEDMLIVTGEAQLLAPPSGSFEFRRLFILTNLIMGYNHSRMDHAFKLAVELTGLLDEIEREQIEIKELINLVPADFAQHWQVTVDFLKIISQFWPAIVKEESLTSQATYLNTMLANLVKTWQQSPPSHPVIIAGITSTVPATARLNQTVASLPQGTVIFPGIDTQANKQ